MILLIYTIVHTLISLAAIGTGLVVVCDMIRGKESVSTQFFLKMTVLTCVTGFFFPFHGLKPSYIVGVITLGVTGLAYAGHKRGWSRTYTISAVVALYFNMFVLVVQSFLKIPVLRGMAPTQTEQPFKMAQLAVLVVVVIAGALAVKRFKLPPA